MCLKCIGNYLLKKLSNTLLSPIMCYEYSILFETREVRIYSSLIYSCLVKTLLEFSDFGSYSAAKEAVQKYDFRSGNRIIFYLTKDN